MTDMNEVHEDPQPDQDAVAQLYGREQKKARILLGTTLLFLVASITFGVIALQKPKTQELPDINSFVGGALGADRGQFLSNRNFPRGGQPGLFGMSVADFFVSSGSLNTTKVNALLELMSGSTAAGELERFGVQIDQSVAQGAITSSQANALKSALGITTSL